MDTVLAAIDVGTNSIHMVVAQIHPQLPSFTIIASEKATVRLGEYGDAAGNLSEAAMERAYNALKLCMARAQALDVDAIAAVATSAVREAPNGREFLRRVQDELHLDIDLISGTEEARRIYLGVLSAIDLGSKPHIIVDIGGGSTELILGDGREPSFLRSTKVGAVRLTQQLISHDPVSDRELAQLQSYVCGMLERPTAELLSLVAWPIPLIGTSGTIESLVGLDVTERLGHTPTTLQGYSLSRDRLRYWLEQLCRMTVAERANLAAVTGRRAEIIVAGAVILLEVMSLLGLETISYCQRALREGLIVDWMLSHGLIEDRLRYQSSVRERQVRRLCFKYQIDQEHAERVAAQSLSLFDQTAHLHGGDSEARELLWAAAMLHNAGHFVSHGAHHKHSYYLIRHGELLGFTEIELEMIANIARYHRKSTPKKKHDPYRLLPAKEQRQLVSDMSAILRLATALNRRRESAIARATFCHQAGDHEATLELVPHEPGDDCTVELWSIAEKKLMFEAQFNLSLTVVLTSALVV